MQAHLPGRNYQKPALVLVVGIMLFSLVASLLGFAPVASAATWTSLPNTPVTPGAVITTFDKDPYIAYVVNNNWSIVTSEYARTCSGFICTDNYWSKWTSVAGGITAPGSPVTALSTQIWSTNSNSYVSRRFIFVIGSDGRVWTTERTGYLTYNSWYPVGTITTPLKSKVSAVQIDSNHVSLFTTGNDSQVYAITGQVDDLFGINWQSNWTALNIMARPGSTVTAVMNGIPKTPDTGRIFLYLSGSDGWIYTTWTFTNNLYLDGISVYPWQQVPSHAAQPGTTVSALVRILDQTHPFNLTFDLAYVGSDGRIYTPRATFGTSFQDFFIWQPTGFTPLPTGVTQPGTEISTLVFNNGNYVSLFLVGLDGQVWTASGVEGANGLDYAPWQPITGLYAPLATPVTVRQELAKANYADLYMVGNDGGLHLNLFQLY